MCKLITNESFNRLQALRVSRYFESMPQSLVDFTNINPRPDLKNRFINEACFRCIHVYSFSHSRAYAGNGDNNDVDPFIPTESTAVGMILFTLSMAYGTVRCDPSVGAAEELHQEHFENEIVTMSPNVSSRASMTNYY